MLLAVLHRHGERVLYGHDVFINVVGGLKVAETGLDLAIILALASSLDNIALPEDLVVFGEIGLSGEVRPVYGGEERLAEAAKQGFKRAIVPNANKPRTSLQNIEVIAVRTLAEALNSI
jgi:DNA repair protein RadA/Sms